MIQRLVWLKSSLISLSKLKLRLFSVMLLILSGILGYLSRRETALPLTRIFIPNLERSFYYVWELVAVAALFLLSSLAMLIFSFKKPNK
jgi:hypothetical protein